ncbi:hypothetical protein HNR60_000034 [Rhodopseudomonas rhenobacensis]|uniref:Uncharacterized protein n=1 Tax=Rhodopseudomonas rhenobacensis TaxID=87461 RepID=A0A7W8DX14_9BRAD|nr:hypothetical protein [Rhodopseudomonas rhenobacensis]MBB5045305.1 hypothetical protein [Rhodopseudomonas rhenobacensis]
MAQMIRTFDNPRTASAVVAQLKAADYDDVELVSDGKGGSVVAVSAPFGRGAKAEQILNSAGPSKATNGSGNGYARTGNGHAHPDTAAPLSSAVGAPTLTSSSTRLTGAPRITESKTTGSWLGLPEIISSDSFFSGFPLLTRSQQAFSSLSHSQKPFSSLTESQAPFSSLSENQRGSASLINDPAPFSSMLGLPVLLRG